MEYHVDAQNVLLEHVDILCLIYGGNLSVRMPTNKRPLIMIGQDELTYHQFMFPNRHWKGPSGTTFIVPKSQGETIMISAYQSCEFGLGF